MVHMLSAVANIQTTMADRGQVGGVSRCRRAEGGLWRAGAELLMCLVSGQEHREGVRCAAIVLGARFS
jgi:hypothetical protein